jgi:hypothetical protein
MNYIGRHSSVPSTAWREAGVHWHAYADYRRVGPDGKIQAVATDRLRRLETDPAAVLHTPDEVAWWIEERTVEWGKQRTVRATADGVWVAIGDAEDLAHLCTENVLIAARADSIYTDVYSESANIELFVEVVGSDECSDH